ncbi:MAG: hypothetical protein ACI9KE_006177 [Polyangiales bacterium]|jgi:hypothetical protein
MLFVASCGTSQAPPEETSQVPSETVLETTTETAEASENEVAEEVAEPTLPVIEGPRNFVTPHHCHPPGPCTFEFETLLGAQHIDVGHGHSVAPPLNVVLRVGDGRARLETLQTASNDEARGMVVARSRDSLEGGAFYVTLDGEASTVQVELSFSSE